MIKEEDFEFWRDNPVTQAVFDALDNYERHLKNNWFKESWHNGNCDERLRADLKGRAEMLNDICTLDFGTFEQFLSAEATEEFDDNAKSEWDQSDGVQGSDQADGGGDEDGRRDHHP